MREYISGQIVANEIEMWREQYKGAFVIVEGSEDARFYELFTDTSKCQVVPAHEKGKTVSALSTLEQRGFSGVAAIVDADFDRLESIERPSDNLILTDTHDLETMLLSSPALDKVLQMFGSRKKLAAIRRDVRQVLLTSAVCLGYLRWASLRFDLCLRFEGLRLKRFVDTETLAVHIPKLIDVVCAHSRRADLDLDDIKDKMNSLKDDNHDPWQVCCGPDLVGILSIGLGKMLGSRNTGEVEPSVVDKALRLAYEKPYFQGTALYSAIREWEQSNEPFKLLP